MSLKYYFDEHVPKQIADGLRRNGIDVLTVQDDNQTGVDDPDLLDRALTLQRVFFTQDDDFLVEAARRQKSGVEFLGIVYAHQRKVSIGRCITDLELIATACELDDLVNRVEYLPL